jgi:hypothetical protein
MSKIVVVLVLVCFITFALLKKSREINTSSSNSTANKEKPWKINKNKVKDKPASQTFAEKTDEAAKREQLNEPEGEENKDNKQSSFFGVNILPSENRNPELKSDNNSNSSGKEIKPSISLSESSKEQMKLTIEKKQLQLNQMKKELDQRDFQRRNEFQTRKESDLKRMEFTNNDW